MVESTMDVHAWLRKRLEEASPDLLRAMVKEMAEALMGAEADALCGAAYGERSPERVNRRNGYRERDWDTRLGSIELAVPKLREGSYLPDWLLERSWPSPDLWRAGIAWRGCLAGAPSVVGELPARASGYQLAYEWSALDRDAARPPGRPRKVVPATAVFP